MDNEEYQDILEDTRSEVQKYGALKHVVIPRPPPASSSSFSSVGCSNRQDKDDDPPGVGLVFLEYADPTSAEKACVALNGRKFGDSSVVATLVERM